MTTEQKHRIRRESPPVPALSGMGGVGLETSEALNGVISVGLPAHARWAEACITALREMASRYGFGVVDGWHQGRPQIRAGGASGRVPLELLRRRAGRKMAMTENVLAGDLPAVCGTRRERSHSANGLRNANLRGSRRLWASRKGLAEPPRCSYAECSAGPVLRKALRSSCWHNHSAQNSTKARRRISNRRPRAGGRVDSIGRYLT
jgi:hypothetical protein